ncbi:hypothetical protein ACRRTK_017912 [Alexandromys fortis]
MSDLAAGSIASDPERRGMAIASLLPSVLFCLLRLPNFLFYQRTKAVSLLTNENNNRQMALPHQNVISSQLIATFF